MLKWRTDSSGFYFFIEQAGQTLSISRWSEADVPEQARIPLLLELLNNGQAHAEDGAVCVPFAEIVKLSTDEQGLLHLPSLYPFSILVRSLGVASDADFSVVGEYYRFIPGGEPLFFQRTGCLLQNAHHTYLLSEPQFQLIEAIAEASLAGSEDLGNYQLIQRIQALAPQAGATLEPYLESERIVIPQQFELELKWNDDQSLSVMPALVEAEQSDFSNRFQRARRIRRMYNLELDTGENARVVLAPPQQQALVELQNLQHLTGEAQETFLAHPEVLLDPEVFNLDRFSQRVVEWGLYKPRYQPFVSPVKNEWLPGILVDLGAGEQLQLKIPDQVTLDSLGEAIQTAEVQQTTHIAWRDQSIPLPTARELHAFASRQLDHRDSRPETRESRVLIIRENLDELEFADFLSTPEKPALHLEIYTPPPWLAEGITLLPHQQDGLTWMQALVEGGYSGGLLADDMGLGKTLQALAMMVWFLSKSPQQGQCLIVAPVSLLENWEQEYRRFFPQAPFPIVSAYGNALKNLDSHDLTQALTGRSQLVLTTYETLRKKQLGFCAVDWEMVVLDEAQRIKTPGTLTTNAAKALKAKLKIAATGTPIENSLIDIWCLLDFAAPGLLNSASSFRARYRCHDEESNLAEVGFQLRNDIGFYLMRRLKRDVLEGLPAKTLYQYQVNMPSVQAAAYDQVFKTINSFVGTDALGTKVLEGLHQMKAISDHPFLLQPEKLLEPLDSLIAASAKLQATLQILLKIQAEQEKVVIFAERRATQHLLYRILSERFGLNPGIVNGETPARPQQGDLSRQQTIDAFQRLTGFAAIIMSPLAAGVGLNVTAANHVIHYGRHWNPAKEDQATDRVYRLGQTKPVSVHLPLSVSDAYKSFDIVLHELLERKRSLAESSLIPQESAGVKSTEMMQALLSKEVSQEGLLPTYLEV